MAAVNACVGDGADYAIEHRIVWPDGTVRWVSAVGDVLRDDSGQAIRMLGIVRDITQRKQAEQALQAAKEAAEAARREAAKRWQEAERRRQIAKSLGDVITVLNSNRPLQEVLDYIAVRASQLLDTRAVGIYSMESETGALSVQATRGLLITYVAGVEIPIGQGALREAMVTRRPVVVPDMVAAPDKPARSAKRQAGIGPWVRVYQALLAVPIVVQGEIYGGMLLYYAQPRTLSEEEIELAVAFGEQVALAMENARLRDQVEQAATNAERDRLARELHDAVTQTLFSASLIAEALPRVWEQNPEEGRRGLQELRRLTRSAAAEMRTMLVELRPAALTEKPLGELIRHLTEAMTSRTQVPIDLTIEGSCVLPPDVQIALYRIAQALNNVAKYSGANQTSVQVHCDPAQAALRIRDNGCGFDPADILPDRFGVKIMHERVEAIGAQLQIDSQPGHGTEVVVRWPNRRGETTACLSESASASWS